MEEAVPASFEGVDFASSAPGGGQPGAGPEAVKRGPIVIDNSNAFRLEEKVPWWQPEVNPEAAFKHNGLIANPNCSTIQMVVALQPCTGRRG